MSALRPPEDLSTEPSGVAQLLRIADSKAEGQRCATCKVPVNVMSERWRYNGYGWEHLCSTDTNVVRLYSPTESMA